MQDTRAAASARAATRALLACRRRANMSHAAQLMICHARRSAAQMPEGLPPAHIFTVSAAHAGANWRFMLLGR